MLLITDVTHNIDKWGFCVAAMQLFMALYSHLGLAPEAVGYRRQGGLEL